MKMRRPSHRVYDFYKKQMINNFFLEVDTGEIWYNNLGKPEYQNRERFSELMRNSYVKDIHKDDIFEGDKVKVGECYIGDSCIKANTGIIKYDNGRFYIDYEYAPALCCENVFNYGIEIIGNTFTHPHLVSETKNKTKVK